MNYIDLKNKHQAEFDKFPKAYAFTDADIPAVLAKLFCDSVDQIINLGCGFFIRKEDHLAYDKMCERHRRELREAMEADDTDCGFNCEMFLYEMQNHEYGLTCDATGVIVACGITRADLDARPSWRRAWRRAQNECARQFDAM